MPEDKGTEPSGRKPEQGTENSSSKGKGQTCGNLKEDGSSGYCECPCCGAKVPYQKGVPCFKLHCPACSRPLVRG